MQEQMDNVIRETEILRKNQKEIREIKNSVREMKNAFDVLIGRLDRAEERISELENIPIEIPITRQRINNNRIFENSKTTTKV